MSSYQLWPLSSTVFLIYHLQIFTSDEVSPVMLGKRYIHGNRYYFHFCPYAAFIIILFGDMQ
jgi:hypothetical protein